MKDPVLKGYYCDVITATRGEACWESGWQPNLVVNRCSLLLSMLMKRHPGMEGILYCAIGEGEDAWDENRPISLLSDTQLAREVCRKPIPTDQMVYLDEDDRPTDTPTSLLDISVEFRGEDIVSDGIQPIREFGLFGGDATDVANSGYLINRVTHARYDLTPLLTLNRKIHLTFTGGAISQEELTGFGATLPVKSIDGVGDVFEGDLSEQEIRTLGDMVDVDPMAQIGNIPIIKLREFRAKARMVMGLKVTLAPFVSLADYSISRLLVQEPEELADVVGSGAITSETVARFQEELAILQIALDDAQLQVIKLADLMNNR